MANLLWHLFEWCRRIFFCLTFCYIYWTRNISHRVNFFAFSDFSFFSVYCWTNADVMSTIVLIQEIGGIFLGFNVPYYMSGWTKATLDEWCLLISLSFGTPRKKRGSEQYVSSICYPCEVIPKMKVPHQKAISTIVDSTHWIHCVLSKFMDFNFLSHVDFVWHESQWGIRTKIRMFSPTECKGNWLNIDTINFDCLCSLVNQNCPVIEKFH